MDYFRWSHLHLWEERGLKRQVTLLVLIRKFQTEGLKIALLEEAETAVRLGTESCCGLAKVTPFGAFLKKILTRALWLWSALSGMLPAPCGTERWRFYSRLRVRQIQGSTYLELAKSHVLPSCQPALTQSPYSVGTLGPRSVLRLGYRLLLSYQVILMSVRANSRQLLGYFLGVVGFHPVWFRVQYNCSRPICFRTFGIT